MTMFGGPFHGRVSLTEGRASDSKTVALRLLGYVTPYRSRLALIAFFVLVSAVSAALGPYLIGRAIDQFIAVGDAQAIARTCCCAGVYLAGLAARMTRATRWAGWPQHLASTKGYFPKLQGLPPASSTAATQGSDVSPGQRRRHHQRAAHDGVGPICGSLSLVVIVIAMFTLHWPLALAACSIIPVMLFTTNYFAQRPGEPKKRETIGRPPTSRTSLVGSPGFQSHHSEPGPIAQRNAPTDAVGTAIRPHSPQSIFSAPSPH